MKLPGTVRTRFTVLYTSLFLASGALLLALAAAFASGSRIAEAGPGAVPEPAVAGPARARIDELERRLAQADEAQARQILKGSALALAVMGVASIGLGRLVAGRVLRPLRMMTVTTRRISADNLHERLAVTGPADEVKDLADTVDDLLERLESAFAGQRRFVANASHELRTPLTTMRAALDVTAAKPGPVPEQTRVLVGRLRTELDRVDRLLDGFLVLARTQHGEFTDAARVRLDLLVSEALAVRAEDTAAKQLTVHRADGGESADVWGSASLLGRVVDNLVDNAVRHNSHGGWFRVGVRSDGAAVRLVVESGGPVLDEEQVGRLGRPFSRLGADRTGGEAGSGLGLSIVAAIATAHDGVMEMRPRSEGGLRVTVVLPRALGVSA
ncbi:HAMP domain-containing sensor histidine kinase [Streptomyces sp. NPDC051921]|uniref:sensor histidine kinase n=1 Tax=Streptomyces sp. NPDC051921 TaxID=3155806 RepID=UPI003423802D